MRYTFEWNPVKAKRNLQTHGISFETAAELFLDPFAISIVDQEHSEAEERWVTLGRDRAGRLLVVIHTLIEISAQECNVRIISARKANKREAWLYTED